jgi:hypothetical protein
MTILYRHGPEIKGPNNLILPPVGDAKPMSDTSVSEISQNANNLAKADSLAADKSDLYELGFYRVQITDYGIDDSSGEESLWLEFLPLARIPKLPGEIESGDPTLDGPRCREFFGRGGESRPIQLLRELPNCCLPPARYGRPDPHDPYQVIGRQAVARLEWWERGNRNAWSLIAVKHEFPPWPGCDCRTCREHYKGRRRRR